MMAFRLFREVMELLFDRQGGPHPRASSSRTPTMPDIVKSMDQSKFRLLATLAILAAILFGIYVGWVANEILGQKAVMVEPDLLVGDRLLQVDEPKNHALIVPEILRFYRDEAGELQLLYLLRDAPYDGHVVNYRFDPASESVEFELAYKMFKTVPHLRYKGSFFGDELRGRIYMLQLNLPDPDKPDEYTMDVMHHYGFTAKLITPES